MNKANTAQLMNCYPAIEDLERLARRRIPHFAWEFVDSGTGRDDCVRRNREALAAITLTPRFMKGVFEPSIATTLFGIEYQAPFGVAPVGLNGLIWPRTDEILARTAAKYRIPFALSTAATATPEAIGALADGMGWFQLYPPRDHTIRRDLLKRARDCGFTTLLVTVDVPVGSRRERQVRAGVGAPPKLTLPMIVQCALRPRWTLTTLLAGQPRFRGLEKYVDSKEMQQFLVFLRREFSGVMDWDYLQAVRDEWDGPMVIKGILDVEQAERAVAMGCDGVMVSNHGGRQFDAAPAAIEALPAIAAAVGDRARILFDSGIRNGLDIIRALALGADFVLIGRAFMFGPAALGKHGGDHAAEILFADLINQMHQIGCTDLAQLRERERIPPRT